mmetsp:Transcript_13137/g.21077  ORF Transcript_13137/g.21077 Transcript_13137/m.21077 type:complete len:223 (+) Transcript_13137:568-1236(+)
MFLGLKPLFLEFDFPSDFSIDCCCPWVATSLSVRILFNILSFCPTSCRINFVCSVITLVRGVATGLRLGDLLWPRLRGDDTFTDRCFFLLIAAEGVLLTVDLEESFFVVEWSDELNLAASSFERDPAFFLGGTGELFFFRGDTGGFAFFLGDTGRMAFFLGTDGGLDLAELVDPTPRLLDNFFGGTRCVAFLSTVFTLFSAEAEVLAFGVRSKLSAFDECNV